MTATYDGKLILRDKKNIEPCCRWMAEAVYTKSVVSGTQAKEPIIRVKLEVLTAPLRFCPFCGAKAVIA